MTFDEFVAAANRRWGRRAGQERLGQAYFNELHAHRPNLARIVTGAHNDPFYSDRNIPVFLEFVYVMW